MTQPDRLPYLAAGLSGLLVLLLAPPATAQERPPAPSGPAPEAAAAPEATPAPPSPPPAVSGERPPSPVVPSEVPPGRSPTFLGVVLEDVDREDVERLELPGERGALVRGVVDGSPASEAGLRAGDVILSWNAEAVFSAAELSRLVRETPPGREVRIEVFRDGSRTTLTVTPEERSGPAILEGRLPPEARARVRDRVERARETWREAREHLEDLDESLGDLDERGERGRLGVRLLSLTPQLAGYFGLGGRSGVLVASVRDGSPADSAGVEAGDVLLVVAGADVGDPGDVARAVRRASGEIRMRILRRGEERTLTARLPESEEPDAGR